MKRCDVSHAIDYTSGREAAFDFGRYRRVVGIPGRVRFLCEDCARGLAKMDRFRIRKVEA